MLKGATIVVEMTNTSAVVFVKVRKAFVVR